MLPGARHWERFVCGWLPIVNICTPAAFTWICYQHQLFLIWKACGNSAALNINRNFTLKAPISVSPSLSFGYAIKGERALNLFSNFSWIEPSSPIHLCNHHCALVFDVVSNHISPSESDEVCEPSQIINRFDDNWEIFVREKKLTTYTLVREKRMGHVQRISWLTENCVKSCWETTTGTA